MDDFTHILRRIESGNGKTPDVLPLVYDALRKLAVKKIRDEPPGQTLQATALVHEAYLRLVGPDGEEPHWESSGHFFAAAAEAMRRILVDNARRKKRLKRGGKFARQEFEDFPVVETDLREDLIALDGALVALAATNEQAARLVHLRYFAGLTIPEAARCLNIAPRTADRLWAYSRAWLHQELEGNGPEEEKNEDSVA